MYGENPTGDPSSNANTNSNYNNYNSEVNFNSGYNNSYGNYDNNYSGPSSNFPSNRNENQANYNKNPASNSNSYNPATNNNAYNPISPNNTNAYNAGSNNAPYNAISSNNTYNPTMGNNAYNPGNAGNAGSTTGPNSSNYNQNNNASSNSAPSLSVASRYQYNPNPEANPSPSSQKPLYNYSNDEKAKRIVPLDKNPSLYCHAGTTLNGNLLICGGYNGLVNTNHFYVLQTTSSKNSMLPTALFSQIKPTGDALDLKERHTMTALGKLCYIYGGYMRISEKHYANMHVLDTDALTLTLLNTHGEVPSARCGHCAVAIGNVIYYFGGRTKSKKLGRDEYLNDLYCFNPNTSSWSLCYTTGATPMGRSLATLTLVGRKLYLFGGAHSTGTRDTTGFCDLHELDLDTMVWREVEANSQLPLPCYGHSATYIGNNKILMFGGKGFAVTNNINIFNITTNEWKEHTFSGNPLKKRWGHSASLHGNLLVLYGGKGDNANVYWDNFDLIDIDQELQEIKPDQYELKKERDELESKEWVNNQINYLTGDIDELRVLVCLLADDILAESQNEKSLEIERTLKEMKDMQATLKEKSAKLSLLM